MALNKKWPFWSLLFVHTRNKETTNHVRSGPSNPSRGLAARATSYSRHSNRVESAKTRSSERFGEAMVSSPDNNIGFERNNRGGRIKSLHVTSAENPFAAEQQSTEQEVSTKEQSLEELSNFTFSSVILVLLALSVRWWSLAQEKFA